MADGVVKFFNDTKGFGFISVNGGPDCFVHKSDLKATGIDSLVEGQKVKFDIMPGRDGKGPKASNVTIGLP